MLGEVKYANFLRLIQFINEVSDVLHLTGYNSALQTLLKTYVLSINHAGIKQL